MSSSLKVVNEGELSLAADGQKTCNGGEGKLVANSRDRTSPLVGHKTSGGESSPEVVNQDERSLEVGQEADDKDLKPRDARQDWRPLAGLETGD